VAEVTIDKAAIERMARDIQREFDRHPVSVPIHCENPNLQVGGAVSHYHGPVFLGSADGAQLAWNSGVVNQTQTSDVAPGFEGIAEAVTELLRGVSEVGIGPEDVGAVNEAGIEVLTEVTQAVPDQPRMKRALRALQGVLAPLATGLVTGLSLDAQSWARQAIEHLNLHLQR
jgi:hypothetical protein